MEIQEIHSQDLWFTTERGVRWIEVVLGADDLGSSGPQCEHRSGLFFAQYAPLDALGERNTRRYSKTWFAEPGPSCASTGKRLLVSIPGRFI